MFYPLPLSHPFRSELLWPDSWMNIPSTQVLLSVFLSLLWVGKSSSIHSFLLKEFFSDWKGVKWTSTYCWVETWWRWREERWSKNLSCLNTLCVDSKYYLYMQRLSVETSTCQILSYDATTGGWSRGQEIGVGALQRWLTDRVSEWIKDYLTLREPSVGRGMQLAVSISSSLFTTVLFSAVGSNS